MKKWFVLVAAIVSVLAGCFIEPLFSYVNMENLVDFTMDINGQVYLLNHVDQEKYRLSKLNTNGFTTYQKVLDQSNTGNKLEYQQLEVDNKGNVYLLSSERKDISAAQDGTDMRILSEKVLMYSTEGEFIKELANVDYSQEAILPTQPYIYKIQVIDQKVSIICNKGDSYEVLTVNSFENEKPQSQQTFVIQSESNEQGNIDWLADISVTSDGKIVCGTKRGELLVMDEQKQFRDITSFLGQDICATDFSVDTADNVYFTEIISGNYYKLNVQNMTLDLLYNTNSIINKKNNVKFGDLTYINAIKEGTYFGISKLPDNQVYLSFGIDENMIHKVSPPFFPDRILTIALISVATFGVIFGAALLFLKCRKRLSLNFKLVFLFLPLYLISMLVLTLLILGSSSKNRSNYLIQTQDTSAQIVLDQIDGDLFESVDPFKGYLNEDYVKLQEQVEFGFQEATKKVRNSSDYVDTFTVKDGRIYTMMGSDFDQIHSNIDSDINFEKSDAMPIPLEYTMDTEKMNQYYEIWDQMKNATDTSSTNTHVIQDNYGEWISVFKPIQNSQGEAVGFVLAAIDKRQNQDSVYWDTFYMVILVVLVVSLVTFVSFFLVLRFVFRPLKEIKRCVNAISEGRWNTKVNINSRDEFADIGTAFNLMTDRVNQYISNLVISNREYVKFVPMELFHLLGKNKITDINLNDQNRLKISILYVALNTVHHDIYSKVPEQQYFNMLNKNFAPLFHIIENNNGIVQWFDGLGMMVLFPNSAEDAATASMQFKEVFPGKVGKEMTMILSTGEAIIGVIGNKTRYSIATISDEVMQIDYINSQIHKIAIRHFALEPLIRFFHSSTKYNYRLVGQVRHIASSEPVKLYEFIDSTKLYEKNLYIATKELFEAAVKQYIKGNFIEARKMFANVLRINEEDKVAIQYLVLCDENADKHNGLWKGYMFK